MAKNGDEVLNQTTQSVAAETKKREGKLKYGIFRASSKWTMWKSSPWPT